MSALKVKRAIYFYALERKDILRKDLFSTEIEMRVKEKDCSYTKAVMKRITKTIVNLAFLTF